MVIILKSFLINSPSKQVMIPYLNHLSKTVLMRAEGLTTCHDGEIRKVVTEFSSHLISWSGD